MKRRLPAWREHRSGRTPVGISACLLGEEVRYDGGHRRDDLIIETLGGLFEFVPLCPEVLIGLGVPRGPIRMVNTGHAVRVLGVGDPSLDVTGRLAALGRAGVSGPTVYGYILKARSPSCGVGDVPVYDPAGRPVATASGAFAGALIAAHPGLPVETEVRLADAGIRARFVARVQARAGARVD